MKYRMTGALIPVQKPKIGCHYHVAWGKSHGVVGVCCEVNEQAKTVKLKSPKTKIVWNCSVNWSDLRHTRKNQIKNPH